MIVKTAKVAEDFSRAAALFRAYEGWASSCPCFEGFERELTEIADRYSLPQGQLWLASDDKGVVFGVVGIKFIDADTCELKRLWVEPEGRGQKAGEALINKAVDFARSQGSSSIVLETVPGNMDSAIALYQRQGFKQTNSLPDRGTLEMAYSL